MPLRLRIGPPAARLSRTVTVLRRFPLPPVWRPSRPWARLALGVTTGAILVAAVTLLSYPLRHAATPEPLSALYLLGVVLVSALWGWWPGAVTAVASALAFDYFHSAPLGSIGIYYTGQWPVIPLFLLVAVVVAAIAYAARSRAVEAGELRREAREAAEYAHRLAGEHATLHRVATLAAREAAPQEVFAAVCREVGRVLAARYTALGRCSPDATVTVVGAWSDDPGRKDLPDVGSRWPTAAETLVESVWRTGQAVRIDRLGDGDIGDRMVPFPHGPEIGAAVGCPIVVEGRVWGVMLCGFSAPAPQPEGTEARMAQFTRLTATAIANAEHRSELVEARARVVAAVDDTRHRLERDLHDGVQQNLFALALRVRAAQRDEVEPQQRIEQLSEIDRLLSGLVSDLRQISRGLRPRMLTLGGLQPVVRMLAQRCPLPVELDVRIDRELSDRVETAVYYIVSEALTNAVKHSHATAVSVELGTEGSTLRLRVRDNGVGGADPARGSGLLGLRERAEALAGHLRVTSPLGQGTSILVTIPLHGLTRRSPFAGARCGSGRSRHARWVRQDAGCDRPPEDRGTRAAVRRPGGRGALARPVHRAPGQPARLGAGRPGSLRVPVQRQRGVGGLRLGPVHRHPPAAHRPAERHVARDGEPGR
ncbi:DUF4118 domain-containing protein [Gandjariella thermophila]|uniref:histidine kinase n=1 Tax=Gandjariella thermophila TaxID=1931992 RepID=A0A4D4J2J9_9PSEU|nr:DUF4118 domain-containing protein [Gandjariella thermophila]GDY30701.1 histidine kinase [Gandjariella thermophila]